MKKRPSSFDNSDWNIKNLWENEFGGNRRTREARGRDAFSAAKSILTNSLNYIADAMETPSTMSASSRSAMLQYEAYRNTLRRVQRTEHKVESTKKGVVIMAVITVVISLASREIEPFLIFGGITTVLYFELQSQKKKFQRLLAELASYGNVQEITADVTSEKIVLQFAHRNRGKVYPEVLVLQTELSLQDVEKVLQSCVERKICSVELDGNGRMYYYFATLDNLDPYSQL